MLSFRQRLTFVHLAVIVAIVACAALAAWWELSRAVHGQLDAALLALAETEAGMLAESSGRPVRVHEKPAGTAPPSLVRLDRLVQIIDGQGEVLARSSNLGVTKLPAPPALLKRLAAGETVLETLPSFSEEPLRMISVPARADGKPLAIQVAGSLDDVNRIMESAAILLVGLAIALLVAVGTAGAVLTQRVFRAIDNVVRQARRIGDANLNQRLPHPGTQDDIGRLVDTLNDMLDRLEHAFDLQRRFTADASHELRSPLSRLRMEIEVTLRREREHHEYVETLRSCLDEVERLTLLVDELLMLARLDAGQERSLPDTVSIATLMKEVVERIEPVATERHVKLANETSSHPAMARIAHGPASLILTNLVDNAVKFSPPGEAVEISWAIDGNDVLLSVVDHGPGIPASELPYVFDRFYRGASARAGAADGTGLGLALSQAIAHAYGGRIEAANASGGGAVFRMRLPLVS